MNVNRGPQKHNEDAYYNRMASSLKDKMRIVSAIEDYFSELGIAPEDVKVLDGGAGGGELSFALAELGYNVTAIDTSTDALNRLSSFGIPAFNLEFTEIVDLGEHFDVVIASSLFHELFSYGTARFAPRNFSTVTHAIQESYRVLNDNGLLIIRDGVKPHDWSKTGCMRVIDDEADHLVRRFINESPYVREGLLKYVYDGETVLASMDALMELAYTITWGEAGFDREVQELYGLYTVKEYDEILEGNGFTIVDSGSYLQRGYAKHLAGFLELQARGNWFRSNALWVAAKNVCGDESFLVK